MENIDMIFIITYVHSLSSFIATKPCLMIRFWENFMPMKIITKTKQKKDNVAIVVNKNFWIYMESREVTGTIFFPCFGKKIIEKYHLCHTNKPARGINTRSSSFLKLFLRVSQWGKKLEKQVSLKNKWKSKLKNVESWNQCHQPTGG